MPVLINKTDSTVANQLKSSPPIKNKCKFSKHRITFLGHVISDKGVEADVEKTKAVWEFPQPTNIKELQRFNGMVNQWAKFIPQLASINKPLCQLQRKGNQFLWEWP